MITPGYPETRSPSPGGPSLPCYTNQKRRLASDNDSIFASVVFIPMSLDNIPIDLGIRLFLSGRGLSGKTEPNCDLGTA